MPQAELTELFTQNGKTALERNAGMRAALWLLSEAGANRRLPAVASSADCGIGLPDFDTAGGAGPATTITPTATEPARADTASKMTEIFAQHAGGSGIAYLWEQQLLNTPVPSVAV